MADSGWKTVNRRKQKYGSELTTFFVGNLPERVSREDLKDLFGAYGKVANTYIANKKDKGGSNFGFVKFMDVDDAKVLEESFKRIYLGNNILTINIARFQRRSPIPSPVNRSFGKHPSRFPPPPPPSSSTWNLRGSKSFASIVSRSNPIIKPHLKRINLNMSSDINNTLFGSFLFGETLNLDTLKALPDLLKDAGILFGKVFYYGGSCALIGFDDEMDASNFLANNECWKQWFSWLKKGDSIINWKFERMVDVKIVGLPLQFRTLENLQNFLSQFGKILDMGDENVWKFEDLSYVNVCILTESKSKISEEIIIEYGAEKQFTIGVVEDECFINPFFKDGVNDEEEHMIIDQEDSDDDSDNDGISDTFSANSGCDESPEFEEGEFIPDMIEDDGSPAKENERSPAKESEESVLKDGGAIFNDGLNDSANGNSQERFMFNDVTAPPIVNNPVTSASPFGLGLNFGPFSFSAPAKPKSIKNHRGSSRFHQAHSFLDNGNPKKIRRQESPVNDSSDSFDQNNNIDPSIDLNWSINPNSSSNISDDVSHVSASQELEKTIMIGREVGFNVNHDDEVLKEVLAGVGFEQQFQ